MSQPDLTRSLRAARPVAPDELRERVRLVAAQAAPPPRRLVTWRRALVVAVPVAAAAIAAGVLLTRPTRQAEQPLPNVPAVSHGSVAASGGVLANPALAPTIPQPSATRAQRYTASLDLRVPTVGAVSADSKRAVAIAASLGGYEQSVNVSTGKASGYADIRLRIPKTRVQEAVRRLAALGRIVSENVNVQDLQAGLNATARTIQALQRNLAALRAQTQTALVQRRILQLTARIQKLQRSEASTVREARYATVALTLATPPAQPAKQHRPGPLHGLGTAFRWIGIGLVYALAIGAPLAALAVLVWLAVCALRRRREDRLLSRP